MSRETGARAVLVRGLGRVPAAHLLVGALCCGLTLALVARISSPLLALAAAGLVGLALAGERHRAFLLAAALVAAGLWWGAVRLEALDRSVLAAEIGRAGLARVVVTGPARRS
ncbi:MAG: hypothetical protein ACREJR_05575, partial [Candidatus Rokuibacteriota bacterium]